MMEKPYLLQDRIPVVVELILLLHSGGNKSKILQMKNDYLNKWILATAQATEGINLLTQAVKNNAILTQHEVWQIIFGNVRTIYVKELFKILIKQKDYFPTQIQIPLKTSNKERQGLTAPLGIAHHIENIWRSLLTIESTARAGHVKDWGIQIRTNEKIFKHPEMNVVSKVPNSIAKVSCIHVKYDGKAKQPNDVPIETRQRIQDCLLRGWINRSAQLEIKKWISTEDWFSDPWIIDTKERMNKTIDTMRTSMNISVYAMRRMLIENNHLIQQICKLLDEATLDAKFQGIMKTSKLSDVQKKARYTAFVDNYYATRKDINACIQTHTATEEQIKIYEKNIQNAISKSIGIANFEDKVADLGWLNNLPDETRIILKMDNIQQYWSKKTETTEEPTAKDNNKTRVIRPTPIYEARKFPRYLTLLNMREHKHSESSSFRKVERNSIPTLFLGEATAEPSSVKTKYDGKSKEPNDIVNMELE